ncbi:hypothetical protein BD324DRAFT_630742 [Kockovaella imperatae]|uniref:D-xylose 1-dehydrogenase (NADP(+), D-xylono-1,5-lactone-forming) n=1 Tax=Kockovaella imperatae TaxID=4999 RepID=A0A1Y1UDI3_9TREE|nr:hypothetical protein BD324DRAFT_630742 [Kockovaella imperatae]ORX35584.1 hypothetical protein BD324DRAFT_630742 [Kockovaella imperatae]
MSPSVQTIRWGIISTGGISTAFSRDLLVNPATRDANDIEHRITAIGSRTKESAQAFLDKLNDLPQDEACRWGVDHGKLKDCKAYGSYQEVYDDPNVDCLYIGTPHNFHYENTKGGLQGGKHVLCEKPFTFDLKELDELIALAKEKKRFLMEAVWTRFQPIAYEVQQIVHSGKLGKVKRFSADFSTDMKPDNFPLSHRIIAPELAGGGILDLGPYPSVWTMMVLYHHPDNKKTPPKLLQSRQTLYHRTNVDEQTTLTLGFEALNVEADLRTSFTCQGLAGNCVAVQCEEGDLIIDFPPYKPTTYHVVPHADVGKIKEAKTYHAKTHPGGAMHYEADEVARCVRDGKLESERMPWEESRIVQSWFDDVRRAGNTVLKDRHGKAG